jgi:hypothetical protein
MNTGPGQTTITVTYYDTSGNQRGTSSCTAAASGQCVIQTPYISGYSLLAGKITNSNNYPLAAVVSERDVSTETQVSTNHAIASGSTTLYAPLIKNNSYSQTTGLRILNVSASTTDVYVYYYESVSPYRTFTNHVGNIPANGSVTLAPDPVLPSGFVGSAVVSVNGSNPVVAEVHESGTVRKMASNVFTPTGSGLSFASHICQNCNYGYTTGLRVMNAGSSNATITIKYYDDSGGGSIATETISNLAPNFASNASQIPAGMEGSAIITSNQPVVVVVNLADPDTSKDRTMTYSAPNR